MRGLALGGKITGEMASRAVDRITRLGIDTVPVDDLLARMWQVKIARPGGERVLPG